jgi:two-component system heavy metal sensor histidine kinase CusS
MPLMTTVRRIAAALHRARRARAPHASHHGVRRAVARAPLDSTRRLKTLAEDLLTLSRVGPERAGARSPVSLGEVVRAAALHVEVQARERRVELALHANDAVVQGVASDLERLVRNLLDNAVRHSPQGGRVSVDVVTVGADAKIAVSDQGPGIRPEEREKIFEPFYRGRDHEDGSGAGLGLAIVRQIARGHGGDVRAVTTAETAGARFEVTLSSSSR